MCSLVLRRTLKPRAVPCYERMTRGTMGLAPRHGSAATHHSGQTRIQSLGGEPDAGRLCAALYGKERPAILVATHLANGDRRHLLPGVGGDRRRDHPLLR